MCVPHVDFRIQWKKTAVPDSVAPERLPRCVINYIQLPEAAATFFSFSQ